MDNPDARMVSSIPEPGKTDPNKMETGIPISEQCFLKKKNKMEISLKWKAERNQSAPEVYPNQQKTEEGRRK